MEQQYGDDFISITDEDGKEYELEVLAGPPRQPLSRPRPGRQRQR